MLIGIGIGLIIATIAMISAKISVNSSKYEVEIKARKYGMEYRDEQKVIPKNTDKNVKNKDVKK